MALTDPPTESTLAKYEKLVWDRLLAGKALKTNDYSVYLDNERWWVTLPDGSTERIDRKGVTNAVNDAVVALVYQNFPLDAPETTWAQGNKAACDARIVS